MSMLNFTRSTPSQLGNASPSIALERGNYRMRAPVSRPPPLLLQEIGNVQKPSVRKPPQHHHLNRNLAVLLMLLALACITCFGTAYYLFTSRWESRAVYPPYVPSNSTSQVNVSDAHADLMDPSTKYLAYLPHSGFHNQRIAFENALLLSYLLRRTLLVPPIHLGSRPIRYVEYDTLFRFHQLSSKEGLNHCLEIPTYLSRPLECLGYFETTSIPWAWLVDLAVVTAHQPLFQRPNMSQAWLQSAFGFHLSDVHVIRDDSPYRFRYLDSDHDPPADKYQEDIYITKLKTIQERLLQVGTLFGTSRLRLKRQESIDYQQAIRQSMVFKNQDLLDAANRITRFFQNSYIGIHLRSGDGKFKTELGSTLRLIWVEVLETVLGFSTSDICELEKSVQEDPLPLSCRSSGIMMGPPHIASRWTSSLSYSYTGPCRSSRRRDRKYQALNIPVYIATDLEGAELHPLTAMFRRTFPCLFFIGDFKNELAPLETLKSQYDGVDLYPFLLPFVDALVLGNAQKVVGTEGSTFSNFVKQMLWTNKTD